MTHTLMAADLQAHIRALNAVHEWQNRISRLALPGYKHVPHMTHTLMAADLQAHIRALNVVHACGSVLLCQARHHHTLARLHGMRMRRYAQTGLEEQRTDTRMVDACCKRKPLRYCTAWCGTVQCPPTKLAELYGYSMMMWVGGWEPQPAR